MGEFGTLGQVFPKDLQEKARAKRRRADAGIEVKSAQKTPENRDKNTEPMDTLGQVPREEEGDTDMANENNDQAQPRQPSRRRHHESDEDTLTRGVDALEQISQKGIKIEVKTDPLDYSAGATALKGFAVGAVVGGTAAGLGVGLGVKNATPGLVIGAATAGAVGGGVLGAAVAVTIFDGKPSKKGKKSKKDDDDE